MVGTLQVEAAFTDSIFSFICLLLLLIDYLAGEDLSSLTLKMLSDEEFPGILTSGFI